MKKRSAADTEDEPVIRTVAEPLQQYLKQGAAPPVIRHEVAPPGKSHAPRTLPFRPTHRQPLAVLTILDDGSRDEGETIRIRDARLTIGRDKGDVTIPFDADISAQHAELRCHKQKGRFRWFLIDATSTNGSFVRAFRASLSRASELIIGSRRYLFEMPDARNEAHETKALQTQVYQAPSRTMLEQFVPRLVETGVANKDARSFAIGGNEMVLGADAECQIAVEDDPFVSPRHARFYQDETGRWMIEDQRSLNGVWIRVKKFAIDQQVEFQLGQQRFRFQPNLS